MWTNDHYSKEEIKDLKQKLQLVLLAKCINPCCPKLVAWAMEKEATAQEGKFSTHPVRKQWALRRAMQRQEAQQAQQDENAAPAKHNPPATSPAGSPTKVRSRAALGEKSNSTRGEAESRRMSSGSDAKQAPSPRMCW